MKIVVDGFIWKRFVFRVSSGDDFRNKNKKNMPSVNNKELEKIISGFFPPGFNNVRLGLTLNCKSYWSLCLQRPEFYNL